MNTIGRRPRIDPFLVMDDIHEKLQLLDYQNAFCKVYRKARINHVYFAIETNQKE
jgi:hypothetical protein